ncbi:hypothetical protein fugu_006924 [Takifugu bimaculatus]|uniref:Ig-like domain-containing protein n=1 Tax=Takifugu bimaculatus TaxID=433685 RepID=A0A4Z2B2U3_9TELE|nr:hypothetical protein fugu_006924 [Takifugu bimaculatus]
MSLTLMKLLLLLHAAHSQEERTANCDEDVSLPCPGAAATQFSSVTWYKLHNGKKEGLIMMRQGRQQPLVYNSSPPVALGEEHSLKLFNVTPEDSGSYECAVNAKIGGRNLNIRVELLVNVCATQGTTVTPTTQSEQLLPGRSGGAAAGVEPGRLGSAGPHQNPFLCHHHPGKPTLALLQLFELSDSLLCSSDHAAGGHVEFPWLASLPPATTHSLHLFH